jgi:ABC-2 type transport system ATP-binding protein
MSQAYLKVSTISKAFRSVIAVDRLSFEVLPGTIFALLGPNGAGKTTTVRMLLDIIHPDSGTISYLNHDDRFDKRKIGYLPEERGFYPEQSTIANLVYLGMLRGMNRPDARQQALGWLKRFELEERKNDKLQTLSKGNQQKVQFISAVMHRPDFAILDEPFAGFDPINQELLIEIIQELRSQGMTIVLSEHQMNLVERVADSLLLMSHGKAILQGEVADILKSASSAMKISLEVASVNQSLLDSQEDIERVIIRGQNHIDLYLKAKGNIGRLLRDCSEQMEISRITTQSIGLHQIYLEAVKRHAGGHRG